MEYALTPELEQLRSVGHELAAHFDRSYWRNHIENRRFPTELWRALGAERHLGLLVPEARGGAGAGALELSVLAEGLSTAGFPLLALVTGPGLALPALAAAGAASLRDALLPSLLSGDATIAFAVTEAEAGSNILNVATSARIEDDRVVVDGAKVFTSVADVAQHVMVVARTPDDDHDRLGFTVVVVPTDADGLTITHASTRVPAAEAQSNLRFDAVEVPLDHVVGRPAAGLRVLAPALVNERVVAGSLAIGVGQFALDRAAQRANERVLHDRPIGAYQGVAHPLARAQVAVAGARHLLRDAALAADAGAPDALGLAEMACFGATTAGYEAADAALQVFGGSGYTSEGELQATLAFARLLRSAPVNSESSLNAIAETVLGLPRSY